MSTSPTSRTIAFGRRKLHVTELGSGYPVLLLHGGGPGASGMSNYSRNVEALARQFRVIVPDLQGYGRSSKGVDRKNPFGDHSNAILGLMDALGITTAHVVGNSLGGACGLRMALDQPSRVSALVLMGPGGVNTTRSLPTRGLNKLFDYYNDGGPSLDKLRVFIREYLVFDGSQVPDALIEERYQASIDPEVVASPPLKRPAGIPRFRDLDFTRDPRLGSCDVPTLVLWGTEDKVNRPSGGEALQRRMRRCDLYLFSRTGHWVQWERATEFNAITAAFFSKWTPAHS